MLFDHGVDSIVVGANTLIAAKCIDGGDNVLCLASFITVISVFWFAMLEEYHKGILILPFGNGISDGSIFLLTGYFMFGLMGNS